MKTMNGFTNELLVKKAKKNWRTRCGAFLLAVLASWCGNSAFGEVIITTNAGHALGNGINFAQTPTPPGVAGLNAGQAGPAPHTQFLWQGVPENRLSQLAAGMYVNTVDTTNNNTVIQNGGLLSVADNITLTNGGIVIVDQEITWGNANFAAGAGGGRVLTNGSKLDLANHLSVTDFLDINNNTNTAFTDGGIRVTGGVNNGIINVTGAKLVLAGNLGGGINGGTIILDGAAQLDVTANAVSQNIIGNFAPNPNGRGMIYVTGASTFSGSLSGNIAFFGGGDARVTGVNTGMSSLHVFNDTNVIIDNAQNLNGTAYLGSGGGISKAATANDQSITNAIVVGVVNTPYGGTEGMLNSLGTNAISWQSAADNKLDTGWRFSVDGAVSSRVPGALININNRDNANGTVILTHDNTGYNGDYQIHRGVLEILDESNLGGNNNTTQYTVTIGDAYTSASLERSVLRVVGEQYRTETITHWINLATQNSFYEVFTNTPSFEYRDANGNLVFRRDNLDGTFTYVDATGVAVQNQPGVTSRAVNTPSSALAGLADAERFKVHQAGAVQGIGSLNKSGDGTLILDVTNSYAGDTNIWHGILQISDAGQINNNRTALVRIGGEPLMEDNGFRPVFETTIGSKSTGAIVVDAGIVINQTNSTVRTTGEGNETIFTNTITSQNVAGDYGAPVPYPATLNKDGAGTLTLAPGSIGNWGRNGGGELNILQGTLQFYNAASLTSGNITIGTDWHTYKDIEQTNPLDGSPILYQAVLKLGNNSDVGLGNRITLAAPAPIGSDDQKSGSYIEVGKNSVLTLSGAVVEGINNGFSNLNKRGDGTLILGSKNNTYGGWTNIHEGTVATTIANNMGSSMGVDLIGTGTVYDMSAVGADQTLKGLRGGTDTDPLYPLENPITPEDWTRSILIGSNTLTLELQSFKANDSNLVSVFRGNIVGDGTVAKKGIANSVFAAGFVGFDGTFDIQTGTIRTLSDTTLTGLTGKAGTYLDVLDHTLTIDIGANQQYNGTIISSYPMLPYSKNATRPTIIKDGAGTLTTSFYELSGTVKSFQGNLTLKQGNIISNSDFRMEGGGDLTFYVNPDLLGSVSPLVLDISKYQAIFRPGGTSGTAVSTVHAKLDDATTGWTTPSGTLTVGKILGNDKSDYTGLQAAGTDSLYYTLALDDVYSTGRHDKYVNLDVTGFGGVGNTHNTIAIGDYLDGARVTNLSGNQGLADFTQSLWAYGSNLSDGPSKDTRIATVRGLFQQLAPDTIANAMFMGLDQPWRVAFDRLNLDSQMVYLNPQPQSRPQQYRGQVIANMRNLWFTPTVQSVTGRSDGNAKKFGIDRAGYKLGFDKRVASNTSLGFQLGYSTPKLHEGDDRVEGSDFQFGLYGGSMVGNYIEMKGFIGFGHQNFKSSRNVLIPSFDPSKPSQFLSSHGRYNGDTFNFSFEISRPLFLGWSILRPTIGLDSEHAFRYSFAETGSWFASKFDRSELSRTRARFGLSLETTTLDRAIFTGRLGYSALLGGHDYATASGSMVGVNAPGFNVKSVAVGKSFFEAGVGTRIFLNPVKTLALVANYDATVANRWAEHQALVGFTYIY